MCLVEKCLQQTNDVVGKRLWQAKFWVGKCHSQKVSWQASAQSRLKSGQEEVQQVNVWQGVVCADSIDAGWRAKHAQVILVCSLTQHCKPLSNAIYQEEYFNGQLKILNMQTQVLLKRVQSQNNFSKNTFFDFYQITKELLITCFTSVSSKARSN